MIDETHEGNELGANYLNNPEQRRIIFMKSFFLRDSQEIKFLRVFYSAVFRFIEHSITQLYQTVLYIKSFSVGSVNLCLLYNTCYA